MMRSWKKPRRRIATEMITIKGYLWTDIGTDREGICDPDMYMGRSSPRRYLAKTKMI